MVASKARHQEKLMPQEAGPDAVQASIDALIAGCGGDLKAALRAMSEANLQLQEELDLARAVSSGYSRQWYHRRQQGD
jgi:hypothetical protein